MDSMAAALVDWRPGSQGQDRQEVRWESPVFVRGQSAITIKLHRKIPVHLIV